MRLLGMFPGQGSQQVGMGKDFFDKSEIARELFEVADKALGFSLSSLCFEGPLERLTLTEFAQPAILAVSTISFELAKLPIHAAAGHSLGEYSALVAAQVLSFSDAIQLVHKRGKYMQEAVPSGAGKMVAIMGPNEAEIRDVLSKNTGGVAEIANLNSPGQTVVAGDVLGIDSFVPLIQAAGGKVIPLNVSAPFHCQLMKPAAEKLSKDLAAISFANPKFPVYSNVAAVPIQSGDEARRLLTEQVSSSVRWTDCMKNAVSEQNITHSIEFGAGGVLTKLLKRMEPSVSRHEANDLAAIEALKTLTD